jgi:predicted O-methyltransferase YrrM
LALSREAAPNPVELRVIKSESYLALSSLIHHGEGETFDWIYLDGSHEAQDVLIEAALAFKLLKAGGILVFDDYGWVEAVEKGGNVNNTPKPAIDSFVNIYFDRLSVLVAAPLYQFYVRKNS